MGRLVVVIARDGVRLLLPPPPQAVVIDRPITSAVPRTTPKKLVAVFGFIADLFLDADL
jgi:plasmid replication initiation protein